MKWYQHESSCHNDEKIRDLIHEHGIEGYGVYHICLELIAGKIDENMVPKIEISGRVLCEKLRMKHATVARLLTGHAMATLLSANYVNPNWIISCPNLLKRLDNWTKRSVVTTEKVSLEYNKNKKENTIQYKYTNVFMELWKRYPSKLGLRKAESYFKGSVKTDKDVSDIQLAFDNYLQHLSKNEWKKPQNGQTWFNNWRDWIDYSDKPLQQPIQFMKLPGDK